VKAFGKMLLLLSEEKLQYVTSNDVLYGL
jgi:hypothetical protein